MTATTRYEELDAQYRRYIFTIALNMTHHPSDAEDVTQNVLLKIWRALPTTHLEAGREKHWISVVTHRVLIDLHRTESRRETVSLDGTDEIELFAEDSAQPEATAIIRETLVESFRGMCQSQRQALILRAQGGTYQEIADQLGVSFDVARLRIMRARQHAREKRIA